MKELSASKQIDGIIEANGGWKGDLLARLRDVIMSADDSIVEEVKWKMATRPAGLPVWSCNGILCFAEIWKDNIKLLFPHGAKLKDSKKLFNSRLQSKDIRAIEFKEEYRLDESGLTRLINDVIVLNKSKNK